MNTTVHYFTNDR